MLEFDDHIRSTPEIGDFVLEQSAIEGEDADNWIKDGRWWRKRREEREEEDDHRCDSDGGEADEVTKPMSGAACQRGVWAAASVTYPCVEPRYRHFPSRYEPIAGA